MPIRAAVPKEEALIPAQPRKTPDFAPSFPRETEPIVPETYLSIPIMCLVCLFFLCWILFLKFQLGHNKQELERLKTILKTKMGEIKDQVKVEKGRPLKGREAAGSMLRPP